MRAKFNARTVVGIAILVSCTGGGGEVGSGTGDFVDTGGYQPPPGGFEQPPGQDPPPSDYDNPSSTGSGASGSARCTSLCQAVIREGCTDLGTNVSTCSRSCDAALPQYEPCDDEFLAMLSCMVASPDFTCEALDGDVVDGQFAECEDEALAYGLCQDSGEGGQGGI